MTKLFPGYRYSPDGKEHALFENESDVPEGWMRNTPEGLAKLKAEEPEGADLDELDRGELETLAKAEGIDLEKITGTGKDGNVLVGDIRDAIKAAQA